MSQLSAGLYYMEFVGADKVFVSKIVKNWFEALWELLESFRTIL
jgi:hypothetical protein